MENSTPIGPEAILAKKARYLIPCVYHFYKNPPQMVRGEGVYLIDSEGKRYLDCYSGVSVHALGHCHPEITEVICRQVKTLQHATTIYLTEPIVNLAEKLAHLLPGDITRTFFCCSGSEANDGAALLATLYTGKSEFLAFQNGLHGRTKLGMSLTGLGFWRTDPSPVGGITHVPVPHCAKCPSGRPYGQCAFECVQAVETVIATSTSGKVAAMFAEPIQGNGGIVMPPPEYFPRLKEVLDRHQILLIVDEVQTGFGRTGKMFGIQNWPIQPDIITGGKALGGGTPIGFFSCNDTIAASYTRPGASTFGGNPVTAAAALAFLEILQRDHFLEHAQMTGVYAKHKLEELERKYECIFEVRGTGLMLGVEVRKETPHATAAATDVVLEFMKDRGFLLGKTGPGRNVLTLMPPLIVTREQLGGCIEALNHAFELID